MAFREAFDLPYYVYRYFGVLNYKEIRTDRRCLFLGILSALFDGVYEVLSLS
jgi:hypothetical protein